VSLTPAESARLRREFEAMAEAAGPTPGNPLAVGPVRPQLRARVLELARAVIGPVGLADDVYEAAVAIDAERGDANMTVMAYGAPSLPQTGEPWSPTPPVAPYTLPHTPAPDVRAILAGLGQPAQRVRISVRRDESGKLLLRVDRDGRLVSEVAVAGDDLVLSFDL